MGHLSKTWGSPVIPGLRYRNAKTMIDWLCEVFGFEKRAVHFGAGDIVMHAELSLGNGMIMIGSEPVNASTAPNPVGGGSEAPSICLVVKDIDAIYARAKAAGATIVADLEEKAYGGWAFTCSDPEGHVWHAGTYDPWETTQA
jgi:uncharacterized glyoxalase superfamily protein PhnB